MAFPFLRPSVVASLAVHGAALVAGIAVAAGPVRSHEAHVLGFLEEPEGSVASCEVPPPPPEAPPRDVPEVVEPSPIEPPPPADEPEVLPDEPPSRVPPDASEPTVPWGARVPRRRAPAPVTLAAAPAPARPPAPSSPPMPVAAASTAGAARVTAFAQGHPTNRRPAYPEAARRGGWEGTVTLVVVVGPDGRVGAVTIESSSGFPVLDDAAVAAVWGWTYEPRLVEGVPTREVLRVPVVFELAPLR